MLVGTGVAGHAIGRCKTLDIAALIKATADLGCPCPSCHLAACFAMQALQHKPTVPLRQLTCLLIATEHRHKHFSGDRLRFGDSATPGLPKPSPRRCTGRSWSFGRSFNWMRPSTRPSGVCSSSPPSSGDSPQKPNPDLCLALPTLKGALRFPIRRVGFSVPDVPEPHGKFVAALSDKSVCELYFISEVAGHPYQLPDRCLHKWRLASGPLQNCSGLQPILALFLVPRISPQLGLGASIRSQRRLRHSGSDPGRHGHCRGRSRCRRGHRKYRPWGSLGPGSLCEKASSMQVSSELHEPVVCFAWFASFAYSGWDMAKRKDCSGSA